MRSSFDQPPIAHHPITPWLRQLADGDREAQQILRRALRAAHHTLIGQSWQRIITSFHADLGHRHHLLLTEGIGPALTSALPNATWHDSTLEFPSRLNEREIHLSGQGITLVPSAFWTGHPLISRATPDRPLLVVYPARIPLPLIADSPHDADRASSITALLGKTRAAVLSTIAANPAITTSELARRLGISAGRASEHATVLRQANLITSHRHRNTVLHTPAPIGAALLHQHRPSVCPAGKDDCGG